MRAPGSLLALVLVGGGCGLGWIDDGDGSGDVPSAGVGPYGRLSSDPDSTAIEPWVLRDPAADLGDPSALTRAGTGLRVWFTRTVPGGAAEIWGAELASVRAEPVELPARVLVADLPWEAGAVRAPAVARGAGGELVMFYEAGGTEPVIGRAVSDDDGATWTKDAAPVLALAGAPAAALTTAGWVVVATRAAQAGLWRATGEPLAFDATPIVVPRPDVAEAFDRSFVDDPWLLATPDPDDGAARLGLWFVGGTARPDDVLSPRPAVGYAGAFVGDAAWQRPPGPDPVLADAALGPSVVLVDGGALMLFADVYRGRLAIGCAVQP